MLFVTDSGIRPGVLVRDSRSRVGKVVGDTENILHNGDTVSVVAVDFWGERKRMPQSSLTPLADDAPEALLWERPEMLAPWADEAPLKLVATALSVGGGAGKVADIREKLDQRVPDLRWEGWWRKAPGQMRNLPEHFQITKMGKDSEYRLLTSIDAVPADGAPKSSARDKSKAAAATDWKAWLEAPTHGQAPGRFPTRQMIGSLAKWPAETIEAALLRLITSAEELSTTRDASAQAAEGWLRAVAEAALRWREVGGSDPRGYTAARVGETLARLSGIAGDRTPYDLVLQAGGIDGTTDAWRRGFLAGMWESFEGEEARNMYLESSAVLGRQARGDLARQIALTAFGPDMPEHRHAELDRLLDALPESDRGPLLEEVIARASAAQRAGVLEYISGSVHASGDDNLPLRTVAVLLLSDGEGKLAARTSWELAESLASPGTYGPEIRALYENTAARVEALIAYKAGNLEELKEAHEAQLEREREEQERLRRQVRERNAELAANRDESRLELRQDMLLAIGELLQAAQGWSNLDEAVRDVEASIALALGAGGAELLERPDRTVDYDPALHSSEEPVHPGARVRVAAPGVIYRGGLHGDRVLLKAQVKHEAG